MPSVPTDFGAEVDFAFSGDQAPEGLQVEVLSTGDGEEVAEDAVVLADYAGHVWGEEEPFDSSFDRGAPSAFSLQSVVAGWSQGIPEHPVGSRLLISIPPELGYGPNGGNPDAGIGAQDTIVFVVDIIDAVNPDETVADASPTGTEDLPVIIDGDLGEPAAVSVADDAAEPVEPEALVLAEGDGASLSPGDAVVVAYSVSTWNNTAQQSTWPQLDDGATGPELAHLGQGYWQDLLIDVPVGSRVLVTLPASENGDPMALVADVLLAHSQ